MISYLYLQIEIYLICKNNNLKIYKFSYGEYQHISSFNICRRA